MNSSSTNSGQGSGGPAFAFDIVSSDGSCSPASEKALRLAMKQQRSAKTKAARQRAKEKALELQQNAEDRAAALSLLRELQYKPSALDRQLRLKVRTPPKKPVVDASPVRKPGWRGSAVPRRRPHTPSNSSWFVDDRGQRGVIWQQSYIGRSSTNFYRGLARDKSDYDLRDEAVVRDDLGRPVIISNMGDNWLEIGAGWEALEDASTRKNAKIMMRVVAPFDSEASLDEMRAALTHFCETVLAPLGLPYSATIHEPSSSHEADDRNFHPHLSFSLKPMRRVSPYVFDISNTVRGELDGRDAVQAFRHLWAHSMSVAAEQAGRNMHYTGLSHAGRGTQHEVGEHLGEARTDMVRRGGHVAAHERNLQKTARNAARRAIRDLDRKIEALETIKGAAMAAAVRKLRARTTRIDLTPKRPSQQTTSLLVAQIRPASQPLYAADVQRPPSPNGSRRALSATGQRPQGGHAALLVAANEHPAAPNRRLVRSVVTGETSETLRLTTQATLRLPSPNLNLRGLEPAPVSQQPLSQVRSTKSPEPTAKIIASPPAAGRSLFMAQVAEWLIHVADERLWRKRKLERDARVGEALAKAAAEHLALAPHPDGLENTIEPTPRVVRNASTASTTIIDDDTVAPNVAENAAVGNDSATLVSSPAKFGSLSPSPDFTTIKTNQQRSDAIRRARLLFPSVIVQTNLEFDQLRARRAEAIGIDPLIDKWITAIETHENESARWSLAKQIIADRASREALDAVDPELATRIRTEAGAPRGAMRDTPSLSR